MGGRMRHSYSSLHLLPLFFFFYYFFCHAQQQPYMGNKQLDCYRTNDSSTLGYSCNGRPPHSCASYLSFRSRPPSYQSPLQIADLLGADAASIAAANGIDDVASAVLQDELLLVPATCSCAGGYYQHNASYTVKPRDYYFTVANNTYQGLSTCQSLIAQNPYDSLNITVGARLVVPLRCACPTADEVAGGIKYLLTYVVSWGDDLSSISRRFNNDYLFMLMYSNSLTANATVIYPFSTLLVPLGGEPAGVSVQTTISRRPLPLAEVAGRIADTNLGIKLSIGIFNV